MRAEGRARLARDPDARSHCPNHLPTLVASLRCPSPTLPHIRRSSCFRRPNRQMLPSPLGEGVVDVRSVGGMEVVVLHAADAAQARSVAQMGPSGSKWWRHRPGRPPWPGKRECGGPPTRSWSTYPERHRPDNRQYRYFSSRSTFWVRTRSRAQAAAPCMPSQGARAAVPL